MKNEIETYETGATSHAVNDLILFTDNTRELAEKRDNIYRMNSAMKELHTFMFDLFLNDCIRAYRKQFPTSSSHIFGMTTEERYEFKELYVKDFDSWKQDHS